MTSADDDIQQLLNAWRELRRRCLIVAHFRGWACINPEAADGEAIEWFWQPRTPVGYRGLSEWKHEGMGVRPHLYEPRRTPWTAGLC